MPVFLAIIIVCPIGLAAFRWLFEIQFHLLSITEDNWEFFIPMAAPWIPIIIWFRPRMRILIYDEKSSSKDPKVFHYMLLGFATVAAMVNSQSYLTTATGRVERMQGITEINSRPIARYYTMQSFTVDPLHPGRFTVYGNSGGKNSTFIMDHYIVLPILSYPSEVPKQDHKYWYGIKFHKDLHRRAKAGQTDSLVKDFFHDCTAQLGNYDYYHVQYFQRSSLLSKGGEYFERSIATIIPYAANETYIVLMPQDGSLDDRNGNKLGWTFGSIGIGIFLMLCALLLTGRVNEDEVENLRKGIKPEKDSINDMLKYLVPSGTHYVTSVIMDLNLLVYLMMVLTGVGVLTPDSRDLLRWGGDRRYDVLHGEPWRLLTSTFIHAGLAHLVLNMIALVFAGVFIEPMLGRRKYAILYILSGLAGSVASIYWHNDSVGVGASGAIFGLYGAILGLAMIGAFPRGGNKNIFGVIGIYVVVNLIWGLTGDIDNAAHIGGLTAGLISGILLFKLDPNYQGVSVWSDKDEDTSDN